jgi:predicted nucleic acid-binding protein
LNIRASPVIADTNVFGADLLRPTAALARGYQPFLAGRAVLVSFTTVAELRYGARRAGWGEQRLRRLDARIGSAQIIWPGPDLVSAYVELRHECASIGHGLSHHDHEADRWIAASALLLRVAVVSHDRIFRGVPGLTLLTTLSE